MEESTQDGALGEEDRLKQVSLKKPLDDIDCA